MRGAYLAALTVVPQIEVGASANLQTFAFGVPYWAFKHFAAAKVFAVAVLPNQPNAACLLRIRVLQGGDTRSVLVRYRLEIKSAKLPC